MSETALEVEHLSKSFGRVRAVRDAGFILRTGRLTAFLGKNGAGKTTLIKMVLGFLRKDAGRIDLKAGPVGFVPEEPAFFPWIKGEEILVCMAWRHGISKAQLKEKVDVWSEKLSFNLDLLARKVQSYSAGNRKKFAYLQSLILSPELFIVDEPFSALDPVSIRGAREFFRELRNAGTTLFLSSHMIAEIERIYDDVLMIRDGEITLHSTRAELGPFTDLESVFISSAT